MCFCFCIRKQCLNFYFSDNILQNTIDTKSSKLNILLNKLIEDTNHLYYVFKVIRYLHLFIHKE